MAVLMKDVREAMESLMIERGLADEDGDGMPDDGAFYGNEGDLDYITRHLRIEAVFNRGLKLRKSRIGPERMDLEVWGDSGRLKSFVRWCYQGPSLARPEEVQVTWKAVS